MTRVLFFIFLFSLIFWSCGVFAQTEVNYPLIPNIDAPQDIATGSASRGEAFSLFMAYIFRIVLYVSFAISGIIITYGGLLYFFSGDDSEKKKSARGWIVGALQGTFVILLSHLLLTTIDPRFIIFNLRDIDKDYVSPEEGVVLEWEIKDFLFQIPFGLLLEEAGTNEVARDKLYDILDAVYDAEDSADAIVWGGRELLEIIDTCPIGDPCCGTYPLPPWPPIPFESLKRQKEARDNFRCWWSNYVTRSISPIRTKKPSVKPLTADMFDGVFFNSSQGVGDLEDGKERVRAVGMALESISNDFFDERMSREHPLWELRESLFGIIKKLEKLGLYQENIYSFTNEAMKIAKEMQSLADRFPLLLQYPFKDSVRRLIVEWDDNNVLAKKNVGGVDTVYADQMDILWRHVKYGNMSLGTAGCLLASTVMVMRDLGYDVDIFDAKEFAEKNGYAASGTKMPFVGAFAGAHGLNHNLIRSPGPGHIETMIDWAENKGPFVVTGKTYPWCMPGAYHALVVAGVDRQRGLFYLSNTSAPFAHTATFDEVRASMPSEIVYIYEGGISSLEEKQKTANFSVEEERVSVVLASGCGACPIINRPIIDKIIDIINYMMRHMSDLYSIVFLKDVLKEDMYQLYKALMLKSLGMHDMIGYTNLLLEKIEQERTGSIFLDTDKDFTKIHKLYGYRDDPYIWNWKKWLNDITYKTEVVINGSCEIIEENDPLTFYLERPYADRAIRDAIFEMAYEKKQKDLQYLESFDFINNNSTSHFMNIKDKKKTLIDYMIEFLGEYVFAETSQKEIEDCLNNLGLDFENLSNEELYNALKACGIDLDYSSQEFDSDRFTCGMEIPVGEVFDLIWQHFRETLFIMDGYVEEGALLLELQKEMNDLAAQCECPCMGCGDTCGGCSLTCDKAEIAAIYGQILSQRAKMAEIANYIKHLTAGFFNDPSEDICHRLNEDIRSEEEVRKCRAGSRTYITKHELITRKLNYSRKEFNECFVRPEHKEDVLTIEEGSKTLVFGPVAEQQMLDRYTKTVRDGNVMNTNTFNWFCCLGKID